MKPLELIEQGRYLGEEFILWLWWKGLTDGGGSGVDGDQTAVFLDDSLQLASERGDVKQLSMAKGNPVESREAFEALGRGMRPVKAKVRILSGDMEWVATLDAATLSFSGMKCPPTQSKDPFGRAADRLFLIEEAQAHLGRRFRQFLGLRVNSPESLQRELQAWVVTGNSGDTMTAPWED